jgi:hypothetical protein
MTELGHTNIDQQDELEYPNDRLRDVNIVTIRETSEVKD